MFLAFFATGRLSFLSRLIIDTYHHWESTCCLFRASFLLESLGLHFFMMAEVTPFPLVVFSFFEPENGPRDPRF